MKSQHLNFFFKKLRQINNITHALLDIFHQNIGHILLDEKNVYQNVNLYYFFLFSQEDTDSRNQEPMEVHLGIHLMARGQVKTMEVRQEAARGQVKTMEEEMAKKTLKMTKMHRFVQVIIHKWAKIKGEVFSKIRQIIF